MNTITIKFYSDDGHGWAAVKRKMLDELGIMDKITPYSYQKGATVYLEEDCDFSSFMDAIRATGITVNIKEIIHDGRRPIRSYDRFAI
jgi:hypothetical protein